MAECEGRVTPGVQRISGWVDSGAEPVLYEAAVGRTLVPEGGVHSLSGCEGRLISGHGSGNLKLLVWSVATGACEQVLEGRTLLFLLLYDRHI